MKTHIVTVWWKTSADRVRARGADIFLDVELMIMWEGAARSQPRAHRFHPQVWKRRLTISVSVDAELRSCFSVNENCYSHIRINDYCVWRTASSGMCMWSTASDSWNWGRTLENVDYFFFALAGAVLIYYKKIFLFSFYHFIVRICRNCPKSPASSIRTHWEIRA